MTEIKSRDDLHTSLIKRLQMSSRGMSVIERFGKELSVKHAGGLLSRRFEVPLTISKQKYDTDAIERNAAMQKLAAVMHSLELQLLMSIATHDALEIGMVLRIHSMTYLMNHRTYINYDVPYIEDHYVESEKYNLSQSVLISPKIPYGQVLGIRSNLFKYHANSTVQVYEKDDQYDIHYYRTLKFDPETTAVTNFKVFPNGKIIVPSRS